MMDEGRGIVKRVSYTAKFKRQGILLAEKEGNRKAAATFGVDESCIRRWRKHKAAVFECESTRMKFTGPKRGRFQSVKKSWCEKMATRDNVDVKLEVTRDVEKHDEMEPVFTAEDGVKWRMLNQACNMEISDRIQLNSSPVRNECVEFKSEFSPESDDHEKILPESMVDVLITESDETIPSNSKKQQTQVPLNEASVSTSNINSDYLDGDNFSDSEWEMEGMESEDETAEMSVLSEGWDDGPVLFKTFKFQESTGLKMEHFTSYQPYDIFRLLVTDGLLQLIVNETNTYAAQNKDQFPFGMDWWTDIDKKELLSFLSLLFAMGLIRLPEISFYWRTDILFKNSFFPSVMVRDRFLQILSNLHFSNNEMADQNDKFWKCRSIINYFNLRMDEINVPRKDLVIDESMMLLRGHLGKQQDKDIKVYMLSEDTGLTQRILVHSGKGLKRSAATFTDHTFEIVNELMENYSRKGYSLYMNGYFTSMKLSKHMLEERTHTTGTFHKRRAGNCSEVMNARLKKGETAWKHQDGVVQLKWKGVKDFLVMSTEHQPTMRETTNLRGEMTTKPEMLLQYDKFMSVVDRLNQMISYDDVVRKTKKWYRKVGMRILQLFMVNAFVIHNNVAPSKLSFLKFQETIVMKLREEGGLESVPLEQDIRGHFPKQFPTLPSGNTSQHRCRSCSKNKKRRRTVWHCDGCYDKPALCIDCFREYDHK